MNKLHIKVGDMVAVRCGKDKKKRGRVLAVSRIEKKAIVQGVMIVKKHVKPRKVGDDSGVIETESALYACKLQLVCPSCDKATRVRHKIGENGKKIRVCKKCGKEISSN